MKYVLCFFLFTGCHYLLLKLPRQALNKRRCLTHLLFSFAEDEAFQLFLDMVKVFEENSCIRWVPRTYESEYVNITSMPQNDYPKNRCSAIVGRANNNFLHLSTACIGGYKYVVAHEMMHVLNFAHEHQRKDRDCYVQITGILFLLVTYL